jgi:hypothetical protein
MTEQRTAGGLDLRLSDAPSNGVTPTPSPASTPKTPRCSPSTATPHRVLLSAAQQGADRRASLRRLQPGHDAPHCERGRRIRSLAFNEACEYPDGLRVLTAAAALDVRDGKIYRQVNVEAWDE